MDANRTRFWMLSEQADWDLPAAVGVAYDAPRRALRLASQRGPDAEGGSFGDDAPGTRSEALARLDLVPQAMDRFGGRAFWDGARGAIMATGAAPGAVRVFTPAVGAVPSDLAMGYDGILYFAIADAIWMYDPRGRWAPLAVATGDFTAGQLAADPGGGVWALDRTERRLGRLRGTPLRDRPYGEYAAETFRPREENASPPQFEVLATAVWSDGETPVDLACSPEGQLAGLNWVSGDTACVARLGSDGRWLRATRLNGSFHPFSFSWVSESRVAVLLTTLATEAPVYDLRDGELVPPVGDVYPLREHDGGAFLNGVTVPPTYATNKGSAALHHLSLPSFARVGRTEPASRSLDSGSPETVWHRLYLEATIPARCGISVQLATSADGIPPDDDESWHEHHFGEQTTERPVGVPQGVWVSRPSELPHHAGLTCGPRVPGRSGLFTVLIQRAGRKVRSLRGRYLHMQIRLEGDGRSTPELCAVRAYAPRFSYVENYLPPLYRETHFGSEADESGPASPADFLDRMLGNFEGEFTSMEDRIAAAHLLTDARTVPESSLEWLGSWIGIGFEPGYPPERRRQLLQAAPRLAKLRGTYEGLKLALEIATGGAVTTGRIVVVEDFRLRRTFSTILGADLADEEDPLMAGLVVSGNSIVGDTLIIGDENRQEFLALFAADLPKQAAEQAAVDAFLDRLAFRVTVLVHDATGPEELGLIRRVVDSETPAHVLARVVAASQPLLVGMASLVGIDTYLGEPTRAGPVRLGRSHVGRQDVLHRAASLDPRLEAGSVGHPRPLHRPTADAGTDLDVEKGSSFVLDGQASESAEGQTLERFIWTRLT